MKTNIEPQNETHDIRNIKFSHAKGAYVRMSNYIRISIYLILFAGSGLVFNSCVGGYVATEPTYEGYDRPASPGEAYVWIDGDWLWNNSTHVYVHQPGYWSRPKEGRRYEGGHWQSGPRGKSWVRGRWNRVNEKSNKADHDRDHVHDRDHN